MRINLLSFLSANLLLLFVTVFSLPVFASESKELRFTIMGLGKPAEVYRRWEPFIDRLSEKTGYKIKMSIRQKLPRIIAMIDRDEFDFGFINSLIFYDFYKKGKVVPVAQMQNIEGNWYSNSIIFVRSDSKIKSLEQLKGKKISFLGKASPGGYLAPKAAMENRGINTRDDLEEYFTMNVGTSIYNVLLGKTQAAATCDVMFRLFSRKIDTGVLTVIDRSDRYPENLMVASDRMPKNMVEMFKKAIIEMKDDPVDAKVFDSLYELKVGRFIPYNKKTIDMIEKLKREARFTDAVQPS